MGGGSLVNILFRGSLLVKVLHVGGPCYFDLVSWTSSIMKSSKKAWERPLHLFLLLLSPEQVAGEQARVGSAMLE